MQASIRRLFKNAEVAKWKYQDYISHEEAKEAANKELLAKTKQKERVKRVLKPGFSGPALVTLLDGRSRVLCEKTIWSEDWRANKEKIAPWPCIAELKWEGDDRSKTGVGRYPPLPRSPSAPGMPWFWLQAIEQYSLDQVAGIPTMEDLYLPVDEVSDDVKYSLIDKDLEEVIDSYLKS